MSNEQLKTAAKDKAAMEFGYEDFQDARGDCYTGFAKSHVMIDLMNRAMEIYAEGERTEGIREGFEAARKTTIPILWNHDKMVYPTVDDYLNK